MKCSSCGFEFDTGKFCPQCGAKVEEPVAETVVEAAAPVVEPVVEAAAESVTLAKEEVVEPVVEAAAPVVEPVVEAAAPVYAAAEPVVETASAAYNYDSYEDNAESKKKINVLGLVSMILGIVSIVALLCGCCFVIIPGAGAIFRILIAVLRIIIAIVAIILGIVGMKKRPDKKGMAIAGLITGIVGLILGFISILLVILGWAGMFALSQNGGAVEDLIEDMMDQIDMSF